MSVEFEPERSGFGRGLELVEHDEDVFDAERLQILVCGLAKPRRQLRIFIKRLVGVVCRNLKRDRKLFRVEARDEQAVGRLLRNLPLDRAIERAARQGQERFVEAVGEPVVDVIVVVRDLAVSDVEAKVLVPVLVVMEQAGLRQRPVVAPYPPAARRVVDLRHQFVAEARLADAPLRDDRKDVRKFLGLVVDKVDEVTERFEEAPLSDDGMGERVARDAGSGPLVLRLLGHRVSSLSVSSAAHAFSKTPLNSVCTTHRHELARGVGVQAPPVARLAGLRVEQLQRALLHRPIDECVHPARERVVARVHAESREQLAQHRLRGHKAEHVGVSAGNVGERLGWRRLADEVRSELARQRHLARVTEPAYELEEVQGRRERGEREVVLALLASQDTGLVRQRIALRPGEPPGRRLLRKPVEPRLWLGMAVQEERSPALSPARPLRTSAQCASSQSP